MKGNNELHLNEATIIEAVQEYLDRRAAAVNSAPLVKSVKPGNSQPGGYSQVFVVATTDKGEPA